MILKKNFVSYGLIYIIFIFVIYYFKFDLNQNFIWCLDKQNFCELNDINFSRDLTIYYNAYKGGKDIGIFNFSTGALLYKIFDMTRTWLYFFRFFILF